MGWRSGKDGRIEPEVRWREVELEMCGSVTGVGNTAAVDGGAHPRVGLGSGLELTQPPPNPTIALALNNGRISKKENGSFSGLVLLERWSVLLPGARLMFVVLVAPRDSTEEYGLCNVGVRGPYYHWRTCGCQWPGLVPVDLTSWFVLHQKPCGSP